MYKKINFLACCIIAFSFLSSLQARKKPTPEAAFSFLQKVKAQDLKGIKLSKKEKELLEKIRSTKAKKLEDFLNLHAWSSKSEPIKDIEALYYKIKQHKMNSSFLQKIWSALKRHKVKSMLFVLLCILIRVIRYDVPRMIAFPGTSRLFCYQEGTEKNLAYFTSKDGTRLSYKYAENDSYDKVLLFFGGNGQTAATPESGFLVKELAKVYQANVYMLDPRGYGRSKGWWPSSKQKMEEDVDYFFKEVIKRGNNASLDKFSMGFSMGGPRASWLSRLHDSKIKGTILHSTYTSLQDRVNDAIPSWLISFPKLDNISNVQKIQHPILVIHGTNDPVIHFKHGEALAKEVQNGNKEVHISEERGHCMCALITDIEGKRVLGVELKNVGKIKEFMQAC